MTRGSQREPPATRGCLGRTDVLLALIYAVDMRRDVAVTRRAMQCDTVMSLLVSDQKTCPR